MIFSLQMFLHIALCCNATQLKATFVFSKCGLTCHMHCAILFLHHSLLLSFANLTNENPFCLKAKISKILLLYRLRVGGGQPGQPFWPLFLKGQFKLGHLQTDFLFFFPTHFWAIEFVWNSKEFHREREPLGRVSVEENSFFWWTNAMLFPSNSAEHITK